MKKYLFLYAVLATALLVGGYRRYRHETRRLEQNQLALSSEVQHYRTRMGEEAASGRVLRLRCAEFEQLRAADAERIRSLGIRLRRVEATAKTASQTRIEFRTPLRDTVFVHRRDTLFIRDTLRLFRWRDAWVSVEGVIDRDSVACLVRSADTLRQEITSSNPHSRIVYAEYVRFER